MNVLERFEPAEDFPAIGLGILLLLAGASKFFILEYWTGYEPQILLMLPFTAEQLVLLGGLFEATLGALLIAGRKAREVSLAVSVYLMLIALQLANLRMWDLAIRDLGLVFYALSVYFVERN